LKSAQCCKDIVSPIFESSNELFKYQNVNGIFYELCDTLIQHESSEALIQNLIKQIIQCDFKISHAMFSSSMIAFMENFDKFKNSKSLLNIFESRLKWLESQMHVPPKTTYKVPATFIGHPLVNQFLASEAKEWVYDAFNDSRHACNFINKHRNDSQFIEMNAITVGRNVKVKFTKRVDDRPFAVYRQNKHEYDLIKQKLNL
jgi:hypothetical protein